MFLRARGDQTPTCLAHTSSYHHNMAFRSSALHNLAIIFTATILVAITYIPLGSFAQTFNGTFNGTLNGTAVWANCLPFSVHAGTQVAFNGVQTTVQSGDVGVAPGTGISGSVNMVSGTEQLNDAVAIACESNKTSIFNLLSGFTCPASNELASSDLAGHTFTPGVWCAASMTMSASTLTLNGLGNSSAVWIFQTQSSLSTATATSFILKNGAQAENVYWAIGSSVTLGSSSGFVGQIVAAVSITVDSDVDIDGRLLAFSAVTFAGNDYLVLPAVGVNQTSGNETVYAYVNQSTNTSGTSSSSGGGSSSSSITSTNSSSSSITSTNNSSSSITSTNSSSSSSSGSNKTNTTSTLKPSNTASLLSVWMPLIISATVYAPVLLL